MTSSKEEFKQLKYNEIDDGIEYFVIEDGDKYYYHLPYNPLTSFLVKIKYKNGLITYWNENKRHRIDGPAIIRPDGSQEWHVDGEYISCSNQQQFEQMMKLKGFW